MAQVAQYWLVMSIGDSRKKFAPVRLRLVDADAAAWLAAIGYAAKAATEAGQLMDAIEALSAGTVFERGVESSFIDDAAAFPAADDNVYNFDKINVGHKAGLDRYTGTIPSRDDAAYTVADDGVTIITSGAGATAAVTDFVAAFDTVVEGKNGTASAVEKMYIQR